MASDRSAKKRAVNLFVDAELVEAARALNINLSEALDRELRARVKAVQEARWLEESGEAIRSYNARVESDGLLSDDAGLL